MSTTYPIPEETGEILWTTAPFYSKQRQRAWRPCSIAPIKDLYFFKVKKDTLLLSSLTSPNTQVKDKIIVNDMTNISTPQQSEYSFRHQTPTEPQVPNTNVLDVLNTSKEWEVITVQGKIFGLKDQRIVGSHRKKLTLVEAFLDDGSGRIPIDIWESHIENVKTGKYCNVFKTCKKNAVLMYQSNRSFGSPPRHLNFWKIFPQMPPSLGRKAVQMPPLGKLPDYCFNFSVASIMLLRLCMLTCFIRQHLFKCYTYKYCS